MNSTRFYFDVDDFKNLEISKGSETYHYFYDNRRKRLITEFLLGQNSKSLTVCEVKLIKEDDGYFSPRLTFRVYDKKGTTKATNLNPTKKDTLKLIDLEKIHKNFWTLISFIKSCREVQVPSEKSLSVVSQSTKELIESLQSNRIGQETLKTVMESILNEENKDEILRLLTEEESGLGETLSQGVIQKQRSQVLKDLENRLTQGGYYETKGSDSWQQWIKEHNWLFGVNYLEPIEKQKISVGGSEPDYLFPTIDGFIDILEIKRPEEEVLKDDQSHVGSYTWTEPVNKAIGQVVTYLEEIENNRLSIEKHIRDHYPNQKNISCLKPRAFILIGQRDKNYKNWTDPEIRALRNLNSALHRVEVLTYTDLLELGKQFVDTNINI